MRFEEICRLFSPEFSAWKKRLPQDSSCRSLPVIYNEIRNGIIWDPWISSVFGFNFPYAACIHSMAWYNVLRLVRHQVLTSCPFFKPSPLWWYCRHASSRNFRNFVKHVRGHASAILEPASWVNTCFCAPGRGDKRTSSSSPRTEQSSSSRATSDITHPTSIPPHVSHCFTLTNRLVEPEWELTSEKISEGASTHGNLVVGITWWCEFCLRQWFQMIKYCIMTWNEGNRSNRLGISPPLPYTKSDQIQLLFLAHPRPMPVAGWAPKCDNTQPTSQENRQQWHRSRWSLRWIAWIILLP